MTKQVVQLDQVIIRFAGDSGDGMQLTGDQFTSRTAEFGNDLSTLPDFPAEIRAPAGTLPGVSAFQLHFADHEIMTPGDSPNVLVAMNPAALKANIKDLPRGADLILNTDEFTSRNLSKVGYETNPLEDGSLDSFRVHPIALTSLTVEALKDFDIGKRTERNGRQGVRYLMEEGLAVMDPQTMRPVPADGQTMGEIMFRGLHYQRKPVVMVRFPGENHELSRSGTPSRRVQNQQHIRRWFDHWLQDKPAPEYGVPSPPPRG